MSISEAAMRRAFGLSCSTVFKAPVFESLELRRLYSATFSKFSDDLTFLSNDFITRPEARLSRTITRHETYVLAAKQPKASLIRTQGDAVQIQAVAKGNTVGTLAKQLTALGATVTAEYGQALAAFIPIRTLPKVNALSKLNYVTPSYKPYLNTGNFDDLGTQAIKSDLASKQFGVTGAGVKVGILSDSYNALGTASAGVASGDLPSGVTVLKDDPYSGGTDEGRAMAEIVHDVAPGAAIDFYTADDSEVDFANGITALAQAGCKVIVDDAAYYDEPMFQDGIVAQAVNNAYTNYGVSYFSAAGNEARQAYQSAFHSVSATVAGVGTGTFHNFKTSGGTDVYQPITIAAGNTLTLSIQWDQPYASANSSDGGSANSVAAYLLNNAKTGVVTSASGSVYGDDPTQLLQIQNTSSSAVTDYLALRLTTGAAPGLMKYVAFNGTIGTYATNTGATYGHAMAQDAEGVAAAYYVDTPAFDTLPGQLEYYSSAGGSPILFSSNGTRLATPLYRNEPAITAVDGGSTSFFGQTNLPDGQHHFFGTSAAAPHAAAVAVLLLQAKPSLTNAQVYTTLQNTASDITLRYNLSNPGSPISIGAGYDYDSGYGLIQADKALAAVAGSTISGTVFRDVNNNGLKDAGDAGLANTAVYLDPDDNDVINSGTSSTLNSADTPKAIPDAAANTTGPSARLLSTINVSGLTGRVTHLTIGLNVTHPSVDDLGFTLITPSGMRIPLLTTISNRYAGANSTGLNITLDDSNSMYIQPYYNPSGVLSGAFIPQSQLAAADGEKPNGTWELEARDYFTGNTGTLNSWSLKITSADATTTTDSSGHYSFAALPPSSYYGTYHVAQVTPAGLTQTTPTTTDNDLTLASNSTATANFGDYAPISTIASIVLDDSTSQRSMIRSITLTFNGSIAAANIGGGAFTLTQTSGTIASYVLNVASVTALTGNQTQVKLTFSGSAVVGGSVADGHYTLAVDGSKITDSTGLQVDAAGNGTPGSVESYSFFRFFGDIDGNGSVGNYDYLRLGTTYGLSSSSSGFISAFDFDGNGSVGNYDYLQFSSRYGKSAV